MRYDDLAPNLTCSVSCETDEFHLKWPSTEQPSGS